MTKPKPPIVIAHDLKSFAVEDTPDEFIDALEAELARVANGEYDEIAVEVNADTADEVLDRFLFDAPINDCVQVPPNLTGDELDAWLQVGPEQLAKAEAFIWDTAVEMYLERGHSHAEAERLARELMAHPQADWFPDL